MAKKKVFPNIDDIRDNIHFEVEEYPGCCKGLAIHSFPHRTGKPLTDEDWLFALLEEFQGIESTVIFSHSSKQNKGVATPKALAEWLRGRKENVVEAKKAHMTFYTWVVSKKFNNDLKKFQKQLEEQAYKEYDAADKLTRGSSY